MSTAKCNSALDKVCTCWDTSQYPQVHKIACPQGRNHHIPSKNNRVHPPSLPPLHRLVRFHALQAPKRRRRRRKTHLGYDWQISQTKENDWPRRHQPNHNAIVSSHIHPSGSSQEATTKSCYNHLTPSPCSRQRAGFRDPARSYSAVLSMTSAPRSSTSRSSSIMRTRSSRLSSSSSWSSGGRQLCKRCRYLSMRSLTPSTLRAST